MTQIILSDFTTWPDDLLAVLVRHHETFAEWDRPTDEADRYRQIDHAQAVIRGGNYDDAVHAVNDCLRNHSLRGYHCTKLTEAEIAIIQSCGMSLPNAGTLKDRISRLVDRGEIAEDHAQSFLAKNQSDETYRANMLWFCFFEPRVAHQGGIERFFRSWGGEALYNSHERDPVTGPILGGIGIPCLIEADVPIASLSSVDGLSMKVGRAYAISRGLDCGEPTDHEGNITAALPPTAIQRIIRFGEPDFSRLTGCDTWRPPLS